MNSYFGLGLEPVRCLAITIGCVLPIVVTSLSVNAQVIPAADGTNTRSQTTGNQFDITGGQRNGGNLFHSFDKFSFTRDQIVNIQSNPAIRNIFTRIVGGEASVIDGILKVSGGSSNLYLMNPAGILFGPNVRLNLPGTFTATTATGLNFENGSWSILGGSTSSALIGDPTALLFALNQLGSIANLGNLSVLPGQSLNLIGGTVVNTGEIQAPGGQVTLASVPGSQLVRLQQVGNILGLEFKPLAATGSVAWTPATFSQLLAKGDPLHHATQLETTPTGQVLLKGSGVAIGDRPGLTVVSGQVMGDSFQALGDRVIVNDLTVQTNGPLVLAANQQLWFQKGTANQMNFGTGGTIVLNAGTEFRSDLPLQSQGRSIDIQSPIIQAQSINTASGSLANSGGTVTLQGLNGQSAQRINVDNIITPNQDVSIRADTATTQFIITSAASTLTSPTSPIGLGGRVNIQGQGPLSVGGIITQGKDVNLMTRNDLRSGLLRVGPIFTFGGNVNLEANRLNTSLIWTTPQANANAGNVTLTAQTELNAGRIEANAGGNNNTSNSAGNVRLFNQTGDVLVDSIQAIGSSGGRVAISGDRVRITGISVKQNIATGLFTTSSIRAGESLTINHRGGKTNQPFIIGNSTFNGSAGSLIAGNDPVSNPPLTVGQFAIQDKTVTATPRSNITITTENQRPFFPGLANAKLLSLSVKPGKSIQFSLAELGLSQPIDPNQDVVNIYIRVRNSNGSAGRLFDSTGREVSSDRPIKITDLLTYIAPKSRSIGVSFEIVALDVPPVAVAFDEYPSLPLRFDLPEIPDIESPAPKPDKPAVSLPAESPLSNVSAAEVAAMDNRFTDEFTTAGFDTAGAQSGVDGSELTRQIGSKTGTKAALIYIRLVAAKANETDSKSDNQSAPIANSKTNLKDVEITLVTAKGRFRKRLPIDGEKLLATARAFRQEVVNPLRTHTKTYLPASQQLYKWLIEPIRSDLRSQGITNLVFVPETGLKAIPYTALHDGKQFLIEQYSVGLMPSLGLTQTTYQDLRGSDLLALGISQPTQGQTPLPMVGTEMSAIGQLWSHQVSYGNAQATLDTLRTARQRTPFRIVHLATHANFTTGSVQDSYIQLWDDRLKLNQIKQLNWNNPPVELLVLSACRTALGDRTSELGLAGLAVQTGVKTTIASLWSVDDAATMLLFSQFYSALRTSPIKAAALRQAQIKLLRRQIVVNDGKILGLSQNLRLTLPEGVRVSDPDFQHPYYWAAFTLVGNPW